METGYPIQLNLKGHNVHHQAKLLKIEANEVTAHNGVDIPPEWPYGKAGDPYSTAKPDSINIKETAWELDQPIKLAPFSVATIVIDIKK